MSGGATSTVVWRPCTFPARVRASTTDSPTTQSRPAALDRLGRALRRRGDGDHPGDGLREVVREADVAHRHRPPDLLRDPTLERRPLGRGVQVPATPRPL